MWIKSSKADVLKCPLFMNPESKPEGTFRLLLEACRGLLRCVDAQYSCQLRPEGGWEAPIQDPQDTAPQPTMWVATSSLRNPEGKPYTSCSQLCKMEQKCDENLLFPVRTYWQNVTWTICFLSQSVKLVHYFLKERKRDCLTRMSEGTTFTWNNRETVPRSAEWGFPSKFVVTTV